MDRFDSLAKTPVSAEFGAVPGGGGGKENARVGRAEAGAKEVRRKKSSGVRLGAVMGMEERKGGVAVGA